MEKNRKSLIDRLKRIEGQVRGLQNMIEREEYCIDVITQTSAVRSALMSLEDVLLERHLESCVVTQMATGKKNKAIREILKVYQLKK